MLFRSEAFAEQMNEEGLLVRIIVRPTAPQGSYEILAGHNRANAARLAGWDVIPAEIVEADDARAIVIATSTNLIQRQNLSIIERGKAYRALLDTKNRNGQRNAFQKETFGENRQRYSARKLVAEFFGVTEYEIRKAMKLTQLIPQLQNILESSPKQLKNCPAKMQLHMERASRSGLPFSSVSPIRRRRSGAESSKGLCALRPSYIVRHLLQGIKIA